MKKLRIIYSSNAPWTSSGYAVQTDMVTRQIVTEGYPLAVSDFYGLEGGIIEKDGIIHYPKTASPWGEDAALDHGRDFRADLTITFQDVENLDPNALQQFNRWMPWTPVDTDPISPAVLSKARLAYRVISCSRFGQNQLQKNGVYSTYIPCTVDTNVFKPLRAKTEIRAGLNVPQDMFLFGMVGANKDWPPRKSYQQVMDAFVEFHKQVPNSGIYFHTNYLQGHVFPIEEYAKILGIENFCFKTPPYHMMFKMGRDDMAKLYNAFDVLCAPSASEGFGVPIIEAQACGVPVITNNWTSMPELVEHGKTGYIAKTGFKMFAPKLGYFAYPDTEDLTTGMMSLYNSFKSGEIEAMGKAARERMITEYDSTYVYREKWKPLLERIEKEIYPTVDTPKPTS